MTETARPYVPAPGGTLSRKIRDALLGIHAQQTPKIAAELSSRLGFGLKLKAVSVDMSTGAVPLIEGGVETLFAIRPGDGRGYAALEPRAARLLVDAALNAPVRPADSKAEATAVERKVAEGFMDLFLSRINALWETLGECAFSPPPAGPPDESALRKAALETYVVTRFSLDLQGVACALDTGLPLSFVKPLTLSLEKPTEQTASLADDPKMVPHLKKKMEGVLVPVRAYLAEPDVFLREMVELEPGDVLNVGRLGAEAVLMVGPAALYRGQAGVINGHRALRILGVVKTDRRST
ncbi:MAG: FliM/FliN family flagellar motor switch protein [Elusimicrobia bacterium]|nr:FliM/FliN family flagellar motor switch protein [Elusimicrobiota bacterium]